MKAVRYQRPDLLLFQVSENKLLLYSVKLDTRKIRRGNHFDCSERRFEVDSFWVHTCVFYKHLYLLFIPLSHSSYILQTVRQITVMLFFTRLLKDHVQMCCFQGCVEGCIEGEMLITGECEDQAYCYGRQYSLWVHWSKFKFGQSVTV